MLRFTSQFGVWFLKHNESTLLRNLLHKQTNKQKKKIISSGMILNHLYEGHPSGTCICVNFHPGYQPRDNAWDMDGCRCTGSADHQGSHRRSECHTEGVGEGSRISKEQNFRYHRGWLVI